MTTRSARVAAVLAGSLVGVESVTVIVRSPDYSFGGGSLLFTVVGLLAGCSLVAAGVLAWRARQNRLFGPVLVAAGLGWFVIEWDNPGIGWPLAFAAGLVLHVICVPLVAHALLRYRDRAARWWVRLAVATGYVIALIPLGVLPAVVFDPAAQGCFLCPANPLVLGSSPDVVAASQSVGLWLGIGWGIAIVVLLGWRLVAETVAGRRLLAPVLLPGIVYIGLVLVAWWNDLDQGFLSNSPSGRLLWFGQAAALLAVAAGTAGERIRLWRTRTGVTRLVVDAAHTPPGGLRDALAVRLGDPSLSVLFPLADGRVVDAHGRPGKPGDGQVVTQLRAGVDAVALLAHRDGLLDDPLLADELTSLARLALYTERLQAETMVQLDDLRASRARIVEIGDAERRRLERDLHDGVQQRLVTLALSIRLARMDTGPNDDERLALAETEVRHALAELREIAHGLFPTILATDGLIAGLETLAERLPLRLVRADLPRARFNRTIESTAYLVVSELVKRNGTGPTTVRVSHDGQRLVICVDMDVAEVGAVTDLQDRVGAVNGTLTVAGSVARAEFPCAS